MVRPAHHVPKALILFFFLFLMPVAHAIGPRSVTDGKVVKWPSMPVTVHLETDLDVRGKSVSALVSAALQEWVTPSESNVTFTEGSLGAAVNDSNVCNFLYDSSACPSGPTNDGTNPLIIDDDGEIIADFFGSGNKFTTLGFASIITFNSSSGAAVKGEAVFNASCLNGVELSGCLTAGSGGKPLSFSDNDFTSFIVHEIGHFLGLDHSQVNLKEATDNDSSNDNLITTMFPTFIVGNGANFKTPERDDKIGLAQLYPSGSFSSTFWTLSGTVFKANGTTELQCANLVARSTTDPKGDAVAALSGDFAEAGIADGSYTIPGLQTGVSYTIDLEPIGSGFTAASGYTPCRGGSSGESSPPSFTALTSSKSFSGSAGETVTVDCTVGDDCTGSSSSSTAPTTSSGSGGCSLIP